ncbi:MAG: hypothetical protein GY856_38705, partial [bacterium]|nr:hypothetical protein [bacterium]
MANWIETSNQYTRRVMAVERRIAPEGLSYFGDTEADPEVFQLPAGRAEQEIAAYQELLAGLRQALGAERHPQVRLDLDLLIETCERDMAHRRLEHQLLVPYFNLPQAARRSAVRSPGSSSAKKSSRRSGQGKRFPERCCPSAVFAVC